jgi:SAM-dependent methyltransferase
MPTRRTKLGSRWIEYYRETARSPPAARLSLALWLFEAETIRKKQRFAVDLGCGAGRDTFELLKRDWKVLAVDSEPQAIKRARSTASPKHSSKLTTNVIPFDEIRLPRCDLVNASWSLPFCSVKHFNSLWQKIVASIRSRGRFAGHFFGVHDEWATDEEMTFLTLKQVENSFRRFKKELFLEKEWDGTTTSGKRKHWHVLSVVAKKL